MKTIFTLLLSFSFYPLFAQTEIAQIPWKHVFSTAQPFVFAEEVNGGQGTRVVMNEPGDFSMLLLDEQFQEVSRSTIRKPSTLWNLKFSHVIREDERMFFFYRDHRQFLNRITLDFEPAKVFIQTISEEKRDNDDLSLVLGAKYYEVAWEKESKEMVLHTYGSNGDYRKDVFTIPFEGFFDKKIGRGFAVRVLHETGESGLAESRSLRKLYVRGEELVLSFDNPTMLATASLKIDLRTYISTTKIFPITQLEERPFFNANSCLYQNRLYQVAVNESSLWMGVSDFETGAEMESTFFTDDAELMQVFDTAFYRRQGANKEIVRHHQTLISELRKNLSIAVTDLIPEENLSLLRIGTPWTGTTERKILLTTMTALTIASAVAGMSGGAYVPLGDDFYLTFGSDFYFPATQSIWEHRVELIGKTNPRNFAYVEAVIDEKAIRPLLAELPTPRIQEVKDYLIETKIAKKAKLLYTFIKGEDLILLYHSKKAFHVMGF